MLQTHVIIVPLHHIMLHTHLCLLGSCSCYGALCALFTPSPGPLWSFHLAAGSSYRCAVHLRLFSIAFVTAGTVTCMIEPQTLWQCCCPMCWHVSQPHLDWKDVMIFLPTGDWQRIDNDVTSFVIPTYLAVFFGQSLRCRITLWNSPHLTCTYHEIVIAPLSDFHPRYIWPVHPHIRTPAHTHIMSPLPSLSSPLAYGKPLKVVSHSSRYKLSSSTCCMQEHNKENRHSCSSTPNSSGHFTTYMAKLTWPFTAHLR